MLIDTHSHINFKTYDNDRDEVIKRTQKEGVFCIDVGTDYKTSKNAVELAGKNKNIYAAIGLHPIYADEEFNYEDYKTLAKSKRVVAIGEIGLDQKYPNPKQKEVFIKQLDLAKELNLPVILHCRVAHEDLLEVLKKFQVSSFKFQGVIHCFTGNVEEMREYLNLGFYLGINGIIYKLDLNEVIKNCPLERILIETDCPYLTPPQAKSSRNEPIFVKYIAEEIAKIKKIDFEKVAEITTKNAKTLFRI